MLAELLGVICNSFFETKLRYQVVPPVTWKAYCGIKSKVRKEQKAETVTMVMDKFGIRASEDGLAYALTERGYLIRNNRKEKYPDIKQEWRFELIEKP